MTNTMRIDAHDLAANPVPRVPVAILVDVSGSMAGDQIAEQNAGLRAFYEALQTHEVAQHAAEVTLVKFSDSAEVVRPFEPVRHATIPEVLEVEGGTSFGSGVRLCLDLILDRKRQYKDAGTEYHQPWIVILTDGQPTDDTDLELAPAIADLVSRRRLTVFAVWIGGCGSCDRLAALSPGRPPLRLKGLRFKELFEFLSRSVIAVSCSKPGDTVKLDTSGMHQWAEI